jgi:hypothetical protein
MEVYRLNYATDDSLKRPNHLRSPLSLLFTGRDFFPSRSGGRDVKLTAAIIY